MTRTVLVTALLVVAIAILTPYVEFVLASTQVGSFAPAGNAMLPLLLLVLLVNPALRILGQRFALERTEVLTTYAVLLMVAALASCQFAQWVVPVTTGPYYYATPSNGWKELLPLIPSWWAPSNTEDIRRFYEGLRAGETVRWFVWWKPLLAWGPFVLILYGTILCGLVLLRKAWIEDERLPFPLVQLPLEVTRLGEQSSSKDAVPKLLWAGAAVPMVVHTVNGLHFLFPTVPTITVRNAFNIGQYFITPPWNAIAPLWIDIYFCLVGFAFLSGRDVPFSMWFFYLLYKAECLLGGFAGWTMGGEDRSLTGNTFPLVEAQYTGAVLAMVCITLWTARRRLRDAIRKAWRSAVPVDDSDEPMSCRMAVFGFGAGFVVLVLWCFLVGMPLWAGATVMLLSLLFIIGVNRMMAEGGVNFLWAAQSGTNYLVHSLGGAQFLSAKSWLLLLCLPYFVWNFKGPVGPQALEALKLSHEAGISPRRMVLLSIPAILVTAVLSYWAVIYFVHTHGGGVALDGYRFVHVGQRPFMELREVTIYRAAPSVPKVVTMALAALFTWFIGWMRWLHPGWRFHPLGYAVSTMWAMNFMWFSMLLGSAASWLINRAGGLALYRKARPFFLGLILGDFAAMGFWTGLQAVLGVRGYLIFGH